MGMNRNYLEHLKTCLDIMAGKVSYQNDFFKRHSGNPTEKELRSWAMNCELDHIRAAKARLVSAAKDSYELAKRDLREEFERTLQTIENDATLSAALTRSILGDDGAKRTYAVGYVQTELAACPEAADNAGDLDRYKDATDEYGNWEDLW